MNRLNYDLLEEDIARAKMLRRNPKDLKEAMLEIKQEVIDYCGEEEWIEEWQEWCKNHEKAVKNMKFNRVIDDKYGEA